MDAVLIYHFTFQEGLQVDWITSFLLICQFVITNITPEKPNVIEMNFGISRASLLIGQIIIGKR